MMKIHFDPSLLEYQRTMAEWVHELRNKKTDRHAKPPVPTQPWQAAFAPRDMFLTAGLLTPPRIQLLDVSIYKGQAGDIIQINTCDDFGVAAVHVSIRDEQGNLIESDYVLENPDYAGHWVYFATVDIPSHTYITISIKAMDGLGAMGIKNCNVTLR